MNPEPIPNRCALNLSTSDRFRGALLQRREALATLPPRDAPVVCAIDRALSDLERGDFGCCRLCEGLVETERLERDFTATVCLAHYTEDETRELERDLELAARVQRDLLPARAPVVPGWEIAVFSRPARILTGDCVDFFPLADGRQGLAIADVMGKGVAAGLLGASLQAALRILGPQHGDVAELARRVNEQFRYHLNVISFLTLFVAEIDPKAGLLRWCNAGHEPPVHVPATGGRLGTLESTGPAIGLVPDAAYSSRTTALEPKDMLLLCTDGLVESRAPGGELFGHARLHAHLLSHSGSAAELVATLRREVEDFAASERADDLTIVALRR